jgi:penicillin G amidase
MKSAKPCIYILLLFMLPVFSTCSYLNSYQSSGTLDLPGLKDAVTVLRDEKGMAFIYARDMDDAMMAQGFVTAQDRLFQMELTRLIATGRICELAGEDAKPLALRMKSIGFPRNAKKHSDLLDAGTRSFFQKYLDGVNAFIKLRPKEHHLEFKLAGIKPTPWQIEDSLAVAYFMSWNTAANLTTEVVAQMLVEKLGPEKAMEIFPLSVNPDETPGVGKAALATAIEVSRLSLETDERVLSYLEDHAVGIGSNNWCVGPLLSTGGKPVVANDPHLDSHILPGPWYPTGLITPWIRAVGVTIPGIPGILVGRTEDVAFGITNAYGDNQDLYVETLDPKDPERYLEGEQSFPFDTVEEILLVKDAKEPEGYRQENVKTRLTHRGPVISGVLTGLKTQNVMTLRWAPFDRMDPCIGLHYMLGSRSVSEFREAIKCVNILLLNFGFADQEGNIGWQVSGRIPIRARGDGTIPHVVKDSEDDWVGYLRPEEMPQAHNPERGWVGTCNHNVVTRDYPYYYSSYLAPSYRYERLKELLDNPNPKSVEDHWQFQRDTMNLMARRIAPLMARALMDHEDTRVMGEILSSWDYKDDPDKAAPTVFQAVYRQFALLVFQDELGEDLARTMLDSWFFWEQKLQTMVLEGSSPWFDNVRTEGTKESRDALFYQAGLQVSKELTSSLGKDPKNWVWGNVHQIEFLNPIRTKGFGTGLLGGGKHHAPGSGETLNCGYYRFNEPFDVVVSASLRMVADLSDQDKILAVLPGGVCGRLFHPHTKDQVEPFMNGEKVYWWFSDKAIKHHTKARLELVPK